MSAFKEIAHLGDVPLPVTVELGRKQLTIREILALEPGSVIKLGRPVERNLDILIGGTLAGCGEIAMIEDMAGVRITDFNEDFNQED